MIGNAPRNDVARFYREADVFLFPTHSDGFGLTQLEAQSWKLPVITSRNCGEVITDGHNGLLLGEVSGEAIAQVLSECLKHPARLAQLSKNAIEATQFGLEPLARRLEFVGCAANFRPDKGKRDQGTREQR